MIITISQKSIRHLTLISLLDYNNDVYVLFCFASESISKFATWTLNWSKYLTNIFGLNKFYIAYVECKLNKK